MTSEEAVQNVAKRLAAAEKANEQLMLAIIKGRSDCDLHYNATAHALGAVARAGENHAEAHRWLKGIQEQCNLPAPTPIPQGGGGGGKP